MWVSIGERDPRDWIRVLTGRGATEVAAREPSRSFAGRPSPCCCSGARMAGGALVPDARDPLVSRPGRVIGLALEARSGGDEDGDGGGEAVNGDDELEPLGASSVASAPGPEWGVMSEDKSRPRTDRRALRFHAPAPS